MPADVEERVVRHALFVYTDADRGTRRIAYRGDTVRVAGADLERGERLGVFAEDGELDEVAAEAAVDTEEPEASDEDLPDDGDDTGDGDEEDSSDTDDEPEEPELKRPATVANKDAWVDFRVAESGGALTAEQLADVTKAHLQDDAFIASLGQQA